MGKKRDLTIVKEFKEKVSKEMPIKKMILFGSRATGKIHKWSDYDIIIVSNMFSGIVSYKRAPKIYAFWDYDYPVDFLCYTIEEFNKMKKRATIVKNALKEGKEI